MIFSLLHLALVYTNSPGLDMHSIQKISPDDIEELDEMHQLLDNLFQTTQVIPRLVSQSNSESLKWTGADFGPQGVSSDVCHFPSPFPSFLAHGEQLQLGTEKDF